MSKIKEIYIELLNEFGGNIPVNFNFDEYLENKLKTKNKK